MSIRQRLLGVALVALTACNLANAADPTITSGPQAQLEIAAAQQVTPTPEPVLATPELLPTSRVLSGFAHEYQGWNNCGPATLTTALSHFGYTSNQLAAANWLKPTGDDGNVSPDQMIAFVNTQAPGTTRALMRYGGTIERLKALIAAGFPVIVEESYDPPEAAQGWMGHYLLIIGYDDATRSFTVHDSYLGPNRIESYDTLYRDWQSFNRLYIALYPFEREAEVMAVLGSDADERQNVMNALETARQEAIANPNDSFAWFNMGTSFVELGMFAEAAVAYDQARNVGSGLPWRMMWYQFGPYEAYNAVGRYQDTLNIARTILDGGGTATYIEETYYYAGIAREALGETERALNNYATAAQYNPNFLPALEARDRMVSAGA